MKLILLDMRCKGQINTLTVFWYQKYMLKNRVIGLPTYLVNVVERLIVQILLPNRLRNWVFQTFARDKG